MQISHITPSCTLFLSSFLSFLSFFNIFIYCMIQLLVQVNESRLSNASGFLKKQFHCQFFKINHSCILKLLEITVHF